MKANVENWHEVITSRDLEKLSEILSEDVVFYSPVVHTPQVGKKLTQLYLSAALHIIANDTFIYIKKVIDSNETILEFEVEIDGILVNGVDIITWN
ncbi:MAG: ketosteroid isomerase-like protein, partial [Porticoccaceae bacterium]